MATGKEERTILEEVAEYRKRSETINSKCRLWNEKLFHEIGVNVIQGGMEGVKREWKEPGILYTGSVRAGAESYKNQMRKTVHEIKEKRQVGYLSMADVLDISGMEETRVLKLKAFAGQDARLQGMLEECLSYLPYLEQMAQTYGRVYLNPREASREMAPFMNRDLKALGR